MKRLLFLRQWGPARLTATGFLLLILIGTVLLLLPFAEAGDSRASFLSALFTATSAVSLTGLVVVDTGSFWSPAGQVVILALIQLGGLGIMSLASLSGLLLTGRISFKARKTGAYENRPILAGGIRRTLIFTFAFTAVVESIIATAVTARLMVGYGHSFPQALWEGIFHAISAFNNAGFSTNSDNLVPFVGDAWILLPLAGAVIGGGLGFPVWAELVRHVRRGSEATRRISITARMTLAATGVLLVAGTIFFALTEWNGVLAPMSWGEKILNAFFASVSPRTAGFNTFDYGEVHPVTLMGTDTLMFIGGGSAGTAGGIKVTTACVLLAVMAAEFLGKEKTSIYHRSLPHSVTRGHVRLRHSGPIHWDYRQLVRTLTNRAVLHHVPGPRWPNHPGSSAGGKEFKPPLQLPRRKALHWLAFLRRWAAPAPPSTLPRSSSLAWGGLAAPWQASSWAMG